MEYGRSVLFRSERFVKTTDAAQGDSEVVQRHSLRVPVTDFPEDGSSVLIAGDHLVKTSFLLHDTAKRHQGHALVVSVASLSENGYGLLAAGDRLLDWSCLAVLQRQVLKDIVDSARFLVG